MKITIESILYKLIDEKYKGRVSNTQARDISICKIIERSPIGRTNIKDLVPFDVYMFLNYLSKYSIDNQRKALRFVKNAMVYAMEKRIIKENLFENVKLDKVDSIDREITYLSNNDVEKLVKFLENQDSNSYSLQLLIELTTGLDMCEINALTVADIDFENKVIHINKNVIRTKDNRGEINYLYSKSRDVPLFASSVKYFNKAIENANEFLFSDKNDKPIITQVVNGSYRRIANRIGITVEGQDVLKEPLFIGH